MNESIIPKSIRTLLDIAADNITRKCDIELWDEMTDYLVRVLRQKASAKYGLEIAGAKYVADLREHLDMQDKDARYIITKRSIAL